jgi:hypothetical protein
MNRLIRADGGSKRLADERGLAYNAGRRKGQTARDAVPWR